MGYLSAKNASTQLLMISVGISRDGRKASSPWPRSEPTECQHSRRKWGLIVDAGLVFPSARSSIPFFTAFDPLPFLGPFGPVFLGLERYEHGSSPASQFPQGMAASQRTFLSWQLSQACLTFCLFLWGPCSCVAIVVVPKEVLGQC
jgi:hypothetical protein